MGVEDRLIDVCYVKRQIAEILVLEKVNLFFSGKLVVAQIFYFLKNPPLPVRPLIFPARHLPGADFFRCQIRLEIAA